MRKVIIDQILKINEQQETFTKLVDQFVYDNINEIVDEITKDGGENIECDDNGDCHIKLKNTYVGNYKDCGVIYIDGIIYNSKKVYAHDNINDDTIPFDELNTEVQIDIINYLLGEFKFW